jgi:hypothetical protein
MTAETNQNSSNRIRLNIGNTSRCIDSSCTGWYVDSFVGKYWIQCLDPKHLNNNSQNNNRKKRAGLPNPTPNPLANGFTPTSIEDKPK